MSLKSGIMRRWLRHYLAWAAALTLILVAFSSGMLDGDDPAVIRRRAEWFGLLAIVGYGLIAWISWLPIARRLGRMQKAMMAYAQGDYAMRLEAGDRTELGHIGSDLNWLAQQLHCRNIAEQNRIRQHEAVLTSMAEGILAIDSDGCFINMNRAARDILRVGQESCQGQLITELIRQGDLLNFIRAAMHSPEPMTRELLANGSIMRHLQLDSMALVSGDDQRMGTLIILNDITNLKRLEGVRRDFVANVSHELKTPITSIKGFMETLLDGALEKPEDARRFIEIIARQADRLDAIIEDLLSLSRIEQESERGEIPLEEGRLRDVLQAAIQATQARAETSQARVTCDCPADIKPLMNAPLLEQAVVNLIDNAIKYSGEGSIVAVSAHQENGVTRIHVRDNGPGIAAEHQKRIFERFYRVDKSRSRKMGGTGLGLSIVKYICQAHGGSVSVKSAPGEGSTFTISLP